MACASYRTDTPTQPFSPAQAALGHSAAMRALPLGLFIASPLFAQPVEDAAHRADRLRTEQLNRAALGVVSRRDGYDAGALKRYDAARDRYARQLAEWRRRVAACEGGDWRACDR